MRILLVASYPSSLLNFRLDLIKALLNHGHVVSVAAPFDYNDISLQAHLENLSVSTYYIPLIRSSSHPFSELLTLLSLYKLLLQIQPDVLLPYTIKPVLYSGLLCTVLSFIPRLKPRVKLIPLITGLGLIFTPLDKQYKYTAIQSSISWFYKLSLFRAYSLIFQNPDDLALFRQNRLIHHRTKTFIVNGSGVNTTKYPFSPLPTTPRFLMLGRLLREKGVIEYIKAAKLVKARFPQATFVLAGMFDPKPSSISPDELQQLLSDNCVEYLGALTDVSLALEQCQIFVLPSYREGTPRSTLEALSIGRPVITTDVPGCRETVRNCFNGILIPPRDADSLAKACLQMLATPHNELQLMADNSRTLAETIFDSKLVSASMLSILTS